MTLNDLIRDAQAIASQFSGGDIPLVQDVSLEVLRAGSTYAVGAFVANQLTWEDIQIIREEMFKYNDTIRKAMEIPDNKTYCEEILKRYNNLKNK